MAIIFRGSRIAGTGKPGESAYEAAKRSGYEGSESQFSQEINEAANFETFLDDHNVSIDAHQDIRDLISSVDVSAPINAHNTSNAAHADIRTLIDTKFEALTEIAGSKAPAVHTHTKSEITDFPTSMPASDVSAWAKAVSKPTYTASEIGAAKVDLSNVDPSCLETLLDASGALSQSVLLGQGVNMVDDTIPYNNITKAVYHKKSGVYIINTGTGGTISESGELSNTFWTTDFKTFTPVVVSKGFSCRYNISDMLYDDISESIYIVFGINTYGSYHPAHPAVSVDGKHFTVTTLPENILTLTYCSNSLISAFGKVYFAVVRYDSNWEGNFPEIYTIAPDGTTNLAYAAPKDTGMWGISTSVIDASGRLYFIYGSSQPQFIYTNNGINFTHKNQSASVSYTEPLQAPLYLTNDGKIIAFYPTTNYLRAYEVSISTSSISVTRFLNQTTSKLWPQPLYIDGRFIFVRSNENYVSYSDNNCKNFTTIDIDNIGETGDGYYQCIIQANNEIICFPYSGTYTVRHGSLDGLTWNNLRPEYYDALVNVDGNPLTIPASQILNGAQIETGSYTGTGTYSVSNPNSLTFNFEPKFVIINYTQFYNQAVSYMIYSYGSECFTCWTGYNSFASLSGNTLTWYHNDNAAS